MLIVSVNGLTGFQDAIEAVYPKAEIQKSVINEIRNTTKLVFYKDIKPLKADLKRVYAAVDEPAVLAELERFEELWGKKYPRPCSPGGQAGRASAPISSIRARFEKPSIPQTPLKDSTANFAR